jgi:hypothetical protein
LGFGAPVPGGDGAVQVGEDEDRGFAVVQERRSGIVYLAGRPLGLELLESTSRASSDSIRGRVYRGDRYPPLRPRHTLVRAMRFVMKLNIGCSRACECVSA